MATRIVSGLIYPHTIAPTKERKSREANDELLLLHRRCKGYLNDDLPLRFS